MKKCGLLCDGIPTWMQGSFSLLSPYFPWRGPLAWSVLMVFLGQCFCNVLTVLARCSCMVLKECVFESVSIGREQLEFTQVSSCCVLTCCCVCCWIATHCTLLWGPSALLAAVFQYFDASFTNPLLPEARSRWRVKESPDLHCYVVNS